MPTPKELARRFMKPQEQPKVVVPEKSKTVVREDPSINEPGPNNLRALRHEFYAFLASIGAESMGEGERNRGYVAEKLKTYTAAANEALKLATVAQQRTIEKLQGELKKKG
jgi:hypothetical protein